MSDPVSKACEARGLFLLPAPNKLASRAAANAALALRFVRGHDCVKPFRESQKAPLGLIGTFFSGSLG